MISDGELVQFKQFMLFLYQAWLIVYKAFKSMQYIQCPLLLRSLDEFQVMPDEPAVKLAHLDQQSSKLINIKLIP